VLVSWMAVSAAHCTPALFLIAIYDDLSSALYDIPSSDLPSGHGYSLLHLPVPLRTVHDFSDRPPGAQMNACKHCTHCSQSTQPGPLYVRIPKPPQVLLVPHRDAHINHLRPWAGWAHRTIVVVRVIVTLGPHVRFQVLADRTIPHHSQHLSKEISQEVRR